ncbi:hypothetical protein [Chromobacterium haemolyticum]|uniref:hypothetical protein n=1 Tax=Chromobacterium haemolyticum TaxID=394935 RepID=UPI001131BBD4|nr:hypothetical protein [Chromobacterium haemolyticum]
MDNKETQPENKVMDHEDKCNYMRGLLEKNITHPEGIPNKKDSTPNITHRLTPRTENSLKHKNTQKKKKQD